MFKILEKDTWKRRPYFDYYYGQLRCTYSITVNLDITAAMRLKESRGVKLYPVLIYALSKVVNAHEEFRTSVNGKGEVGIWETMHPCYTVFHKETETFSNLWTEWNEDIHCFMDNYNRDICLYGDKNAIHAKPSAPENVFPVSSLPWVTFTGFNLNIYADGSYLLPIFTFGKYFQEGMKTFIPLSVQVHHAVCDGFHVSRFVAEVQQVLSAVGLRWEGRM